MSNGQGKKAVQAGAVAGKRAMEALQNEEKQQEKSLMDYFGFKSKDADDAMQALSDSLKADEERRAGLYAIERALVRRLVKGEADMERRHYAEQDMAALKDPRYKRNVYSRPVFTESDPDTLRARFSKENSDWDMMLMQLLGRTEADDPNRNMFRAGKAETVPFSQHLGQMDEPTRKIIQMIMEEERQLYPGKVEQSSEFLNNLIRDYRGN